MSGHTVVDRQATFDTDPLSAHIQKGHLKLPVIGSNGPELSTISDKSEGLVKQESPRIVVNKDEKHGNATFENSSVINSFEKQQVSSKHLEPSTENSKPVVDKLSVLKGLNTKRAKGPAKEPKEDQNNQLNQPNKDVPKSRDPAAGGKIKVYVDKKQEAGDKTQSKQVEPKSSEKDNNKGAEKITNNKDIDSKSTTNSQSDSKTNAQNVIKVSDKKKLSNDAKRQVQHPGQTSQTSLKQTASTNEDKSPLNKTNVLKGFNAKRASSPVQTDSFDLPRYNPGSNARKPLTLTTEKQSESKGNGSNKSESPRKPLESNKGEAKTVGKKTNKLNNAFPPREFSIEVTNRKEQPENKPVVKRQQYKNNLLVNSAPLKTPLDNQVKIKNEISADGNVNSIHSAETKGITHFETSNKRPHMSQDKLLSNNDKSVSKQESPRKESKELVDRNDTALTYVVPGKAKGDFKLRPVIHSGDTIQEEEKSNITEYKAKTSSRKMDKQNNVRRETFEQVYAERNTLLNAEIAYKQRIKQLEDEANGFLKAIEDLTAENAELRQRIERLEEEGSNKGQSKETKISGLDETRELKAQIIQLQSENQKLNEENVKIKADHYENLKKLHALESNVTESARSKDLSKDSMGNEQLIKEMKQLRDKNAKLETRVKSLEFDNKGLTETLSQKKDELVELLGVMKDENKFDKELKELNSKVLRLTREKQESELANAKEKRVLNDQLNETKSHLDDMSNELAEQKLQNHDLQSEISSLTNENKKFKALCNAQAGEINELQKEVTELKALLMDSNAKYDILLSETENTNADLKRTKEDLEKFNKELQTLISDKELQISKLIAQLDSMRQEKDTERKSHKEYQDITSSEMERLKLLEKDMSHKESELKHYIERNEESDRKRKQLEIQLEDKGFLVSNLEQQVFELNMKLDNISQRMSQIDKDKRDMENDRREWEVKRDKINDIESSNKRLLEENRRLRNQIEMASFSQEKKQPIDRTNDNVQHVKEAWSASENQESKEQAIYVLREKKKLHVDAEQGGNRHRQRAPHVKSGPIKSNKPPATKREPSKTVTNSSRSLEDLRRTPIRTPESEHSLPELRHPTGLTYGGLQGYTQIHRDRIRAAHKRVY